METYVYCHKKESTGEPFYIGVGNLYRTTNFYGRNPIWNKIYRKHGATVNIIIRCATREEALEIEKFFISIYGRRCDNTGILSNITIGGDGGSGLDKKVTQYTLEGVKINSFRNAKEAIEELNIGGSYKTIGRVCRGKRPTAFGYMWSYTNADKIKPINLKHKKAVKQYTLDGELIKTHRTVTAAAKYVNISPSSISASCLGRQKTSAGFIWKYKN